MNEKKVGLGERLYCVPDHGAFVCRERPTEGAAGTIDGNDNGFSTGGVLAAGVLAAGASSIGLRNSAGILRAEASPGEGVLPDRWIADSAVISLSQQMEASVDRYLSSLSYRDVDGSVQTVTPELRDILRPSMVRYLGNRSFMMINGQPSFTPFHLQQALSRALVAQGLAHPAAMQTAPGNVISLRYDPADERFLEDRYFGTKEIFQQDPHARGQFRLRYAQALWSQILENPKEMVTPAMRERAFQSASFAFGVKEGGAEMAVPDMSPRDAMRPDRYSETLSADLDVDITRRLEEARINFEGLEGRLRASESIGSISAQDVEMQFLHEYRQHLTTPDIDPATGRWIAYGHGEAKVVDGSIAYTGALGAAVEQIESLYGKDVARLLFAPPSHLRTVLCRAEMLLDRRLGRDRFVGRETWFPAVESARMLGGGTSRTSHSDSVDMLGFDPLAFILPEGISVRGDPRQALVDNTTLTMDTLHVLETFAQGSETFRELDSRVKVDVAQSVARRMRYDASGRYRGEPGLDAVVPRGVLEGALREQNLDLRDYGELPRISLNRDILHGGTIGSHVQALHEMLGSGAAKQHFEQVVPDATDHARSLMAEYILVRWAGMSPKMRAKFGAGEQPSENFVHALLRSTERGEMSDMAIVTALETSERIGETARAEVQRFLEGHEAYGGAEKAELRERIAARFAAHAAERALNPGLEQGRDGRIFFQADTVSMGDIRAVHYEVHVEQYLVENGIYEGEPDVAERRQRLARHAFELALRDPRVRSGDKGMTLDRAVISVLERSVDSRPALMVQPRDPRSVREDLLFREIHARALAAANADTTVEPGQKRLHAAIVANIIVNDPTLRQSYQEGNRELRGEILHRGLETLTRGAVRPGHEASAPTAGPRVREPGVRELRETRDQMRESLERFREQRAKVEGRSSRVGARR